MQFALRTPTPRINRDSCARRCGVTAKRPSISSRSTVSAGGETLDDGRRIGLAEALLGLCGFRVVDVVETDSELVASAPTRVFCGSYRERAEPPVPRTSASRGSHPNARSERRRGHDAGWVTTPVRTSDCRGLAPETGNGHWVPLAVVARNVVDIHPRLSLRGECGAV
jgi:hypothetical protein